MTAGSAPRDVTVTMVGFARTLRAAGVGASTDRVRAMLTALNALDVTCARDAYWAGRLTLCAGPVDIARYDAAFAAYFRGELAAASSVGPPPRSARVLALAPAPEASGAADLPEQTLATAAAETELLRGKDVALLTDDERADVRRMIARLHPTGPVRRSLRVTPGRRGEIDPRRTVREMLRHGGEIAELPRRERRTRPRRIVLIVDISGSMEPYADAHLRFAHALARRRRHVEAFTIGTRLTRVTRALHERDPDVALRAVAAAVPDWSGGTRLGELVKAFLDRWGQRGTARGAVVVIVSDGWERGDPALLATQLARLRRLAHALVWVNPHAGKDGFAPATAGMRAALPYVDALVAGHTVAAFDDLARMLSADIPPGRVAGQRGNMTARPNEETTSLARAGRV